MSDDVETETNKPRRPLTLRRTETGAVKQSFSHGRSKTVVVETKKRRVLGAKGADAPVEAVWGGGTAASSPGCTALCGEMADGSSTSWLLLQAAS